MSQDIREEVIPHRHWGVFFNFTADLRKESDNGGSGLLVEAMGNHWRKQQRNPFVWETDKHWLSTVAFHGKVLTTLDMQEAMRINSNPMILYHYSICGSRLTPSDGQCDLWATRDYGGIYQPKLKGSPNIVR